MYFHEVLPVLLLFFYFIGLLLVLFIALLLLPLTFVNWIVHKREIKFYNSFPSFPLIEKYWKILAEK